MTSALRRMLTIFTLTILPVVLTVALIAPAAGCAAFVASLPVIIAAILDGAQIIDAIEHFVDAYFVAHPDPIAQAKVSEAVARCRSALNIALRSAQGAQEVDEQKVDAAFNDFKAAYIALLGLCKPYGVQPAGGKLAASPGKLEVPEPLILVRGLR